MHSMIGNPWNPMPGWRFPGLLDDPTAAVNSLYNRGAFDAVAVPYAFHVREGLFGDQILTRVLRTNGEDGILLAQFISQMRQAYGQHGEDAAWRYINDQFCWSRNGVYVTPDPFWSRSPQCHVLWQNDVWVLTCNTNKPPGFEQVEPPQGSTNPLIPGDDLRRWSLYPRWAPENDQSGQPKPYTLYQSADAGDAETLSTWIYRAGQFPFPWLTLRGLSADVYGDTIRCTPVNP